MSYYVGALPFKSLSVGLLQRLVEKARLASKAASGRYAFFTQNPANRAAALTANRRAQDAWTIVVASAEALGQNPIALAALAEAQNEMGRLKHDEAVLITPAPGTMMTTSPWPLALGAAVVYALWRLWRL